MLRQERVVTIATVNVAQEMGIKDDELASILGVSVSLVSDWRNGSVAIKIDSDVYLAALSLIRLYKKIVSIVGIESAYVRGWLDAENRALNGVPRDLLKTSNGLLGVERYLDNHCGLI